MRWNGVLMWWRKTVTRLRDPSAEIDTLTVKLLLFIFAIVASGIFVGVVWSALSTDITDAVTTLQNLF